MAEICNQIMHVDDDGDTRKVVKTILEHKGYTVQSIGSGKECLQKLQRKKPDIILLDMMMPDMTGWDVFLKIKKNTRLKNTKVAFLSVIPVAEEKKQEMHKQGIVTYVTKPFTEDELLRKIEEMGEKEEQKKMSVGEFVAQIQKYGPVKKECELLSSLIILTTLEEQPLIGTMDMTQEIIARIEQKLQENTLSKEIQQALQTKCAFFVGSLTLYSLLAKLEEYQFIKANVCGKTKLYELTEKGKQLKRALHTAFVACLKNKK